MKEIDYKRFIRCPKCYGKLEEKINLRKYIYCKICKASFKHSQNYFDFIKEDKLDEIALLALRTWGEDLHKEGKRNSSHLDTMKKRLPGKLTQVNGNILEIGFGTGTDLIEFAKNRANNVVGVDIGQNAISIAKELNSFENLIIIRSDAQSLPLDKDKFDLIYSYGVIHHTKNPLKVLSECKRVLKNTGLMCLYVYSSHNQNRWKSFGVLAERLIMKSMYHYPKNIKLLICFLITPVAWLLFTVPSKFLLLIGFYGLSKKMPFHWGKGPFSILPDLKDRLLSPINHRYSKESFESMLISLGMKSISSIEDETGLYVAAKIINN